MLIFANKFKGNREGGVEGKISFIICPFPFWKAKIWFISGETDAL